MSYQNQNNFTRGPQIFAHQMRMLGQGSIVVLYKISKEDLFYRITMTEYEKGKHTVYYLLNLIDDFSYLSLFL